jgi:hypothetical protein
MFLEDICDQPMIPGSTPGACNSEGRPSNSIRDWCRMMPGVLTWTAPHPLPIPWIQRPATTSYPSGNQAIADVIEDLEVEPPTCLGTQETARQPQDTYSYHSMPSKKSSS